eukprot:182252-Rhodomonas_salina.1
MSVQRRAGYSGVPGGDGRGSGYLTAWTRARREIASWLHIGDIDVSYSHSCPPQYQRERETHKHRHRQTDRQTDTHADTDRHRV